MLSRTGYTRPTLQQKIQEHLQQNWDRGIPETHFKFRNAQPLIQHLQEPYFTEARNALLQSPDWPQSRVERFEFYFRLTTYIGPADTVTQLQKERYSRAERVKTIIFGTYQDPEAAKNAIDVARSNGLQERCPGCDFAYIVIRDGIRELHGMHYSLFRAAELMHQTFIPSFLTRADQIARAGENYDGEWQNQGSYRPFIPPEQQNPPGLGLTPGRFGPPTDWYKHVEYSGESSGSQPAVKHSRGNEGYEVLSSPTFSYSIVYRFKLPLTDSAIVRE